MLELLQLNLLTPPILAFVLGMLGAFLKSDLKLPDALYASLSIYLMFAIGLKGGVALSNESIGAVWQPALAGVALGGAIPVWTFFLFRGPGGLATADAAAIAAHYGSISIVTFLAATTFLQDSGLRYEAYMPAIAALMEIPAIAIALGLAQREAGGEGSREALRETLTGRSIMLLAGGLAIGWATGERGLAKIAAFYVDPFQGALTLFLLEMGRVAASRLSDLRQGGVFLLGFAVLGPIVHGLVGVTLGTWAGLSVGGAMVLGVLAASASYIAAPAAVRLALPQANPSLFLPPVLGVTFPFNLTLGIPLLYTFSKWMGGGG